ncbi:MAG: T9SS type A sorting domain-containing protein [Lewinellaceae bacterium]|nr:T9SS type A sorting domain-containing protein [Lewinellaceae bacterium]
MPPNSASKLELPPYFEFVENTPPNQILNKGFLIESTSPITVYYEVIGTPPNNPEIFSLKGRNALGKRFFIPFQNVLNNTTTFSPQPYAAFDIVATEDNTQITIIPTKNIIGGTANTPKVVNLNKGQSFSGQAASTIANERPGGSEVIADKPIAITVKDDLVDGGSYYGNFCRDLIGSQIVPIEKIGTKYVAQKGFLNGNEFVFVIATEPGTQIYFNGIDQGTFGSADVLTLTISSGSHFIESNNPIYVFQMTGIGCELGGEILPALDCSGSKSIRFVRTTDESFYLFVVTKQGYEDGFLLNNNSNLIPSNIFQTVPGSNGQYVAAILPINNSQIPAGQSAIVENTLGDFQMGFLNGGNVTGCRFGYFSDFGNFIPQQTQLTLCPNTPITINGQEISQPTTLYDTIPGVQGCDTLVTYTVTLAPYDLITRIENVQCVNGQINLEYTICNQGSAGLPPVTLVAFYDGDPTQGPATYLGSINIQTSGADSCRTEVLLDAGTPLGLTNGMTLYAVVNDDGSLPTPFSLNSFPVTDIEECNYANNFDSTLIQLPSSPTLDLGPIIILCQDSTVVLDAGPGFVSYLWQDGSSSQTFAASTTGAYWVEATDSCGFIQRDSVLISPSLLADVKLPDTVLCAGQTYTLSVTGFDNYSWAPPAGLSCTDCPTVNIQPAATTTYTLLASTTDGCILKDTFTVTILPLTIISDTLEFCPGETITVGGQLYTEPTTVLDTIPDPNGCPLVLEYVLRYATTPNATISIDCIEDINIATLAGTGAVPVDYDLPIATTTCPCPGVSLTLTEGLPSGSLFPVAKTKVCYEARDSCGTVDSCCFTVIVREALPCDVKEIGCMRWELLRITQNAAKERTYRIRAINKCSDPMIYTAFELPDGTKAVKPADNTMYITPDGRDYQVRNPNFSPFYSIRFKSLSDSIANGESDIFEYTLPPQSEPDYIHVTARLAPQQFFEAYLNTFNCPVQPESKPAAVSGLGLRVFPNPTSGTLFADLSDFKGQEVKLRVFEARGQLIKQLDLVADTTPQEIQLSRDLPSGLYILAVETRNGERQVVRFALQR